MVQMFTYLLGIYLTASSSNSVSAVSAQEPKLIAGTCSVATSPFDPSEDEH